MEKDIEALKIRSGERTGKRLLNLNLRGWRSGGVAPEEADEDLPIIMSRRRSRRQRTVYICIYIYIYIHIYVYVSVCVYIYIYIYIYSET